MDKLKLNLGGGYIYIKGFKRVDIDPATQPDFLLDVRDLKTIKTNSVEEIIASHILEHIPPNDTFRTLREWYRVLKPGGRILIIVPDCGWAMRMWVKGRIRDCCLLKTFLGGDPTATPYMLHKNIFWDKRLDRFLIITGYTDIKNISKENSGELKFIAKKPK